MAKQNSFIPAIQQFSNFLGQYMQQQGQLAEKTYDLNKKREGEQFISIYGQKLREAKTPEEVNRIIGEATQYAGERGLTPHLSVVGALAQSQGNIIKLGQDKQRADLFVNTLKSTYGDATAPFEGNKQAKVSDIVTAIQTKYANDPTMQAEALDQVAKSINKIESGIIQNKKGGFDIINSTKSTTGETIASGSPIAVGFDEQGRPFEDANANNKIDAGEAYVNARDAEKLNQIQQQDKRWRSQFGQMTRRNYLNPETKQWESVLENNYSGNLYKVKGGKQGDLITDEGWVSEQAYKAGGTLSAAKVKLVAGNARVIRNNLFNKLGNTDVGFFKTYKQFNSSTGYIDEIGVVEKLNEIQLEGGSEYQKLKDKGIYDLLDKYLESSVEHEQIYNNYKKVFGQDPTNEDGTPIEAPAKDTSLPSQQGRAWVVPDKSAKNGFKSFLTKDAADNYYRKLKGQ